MIEAPVFSASDGVRHGFFTREGGVSEGAFASLNCGFGSGDTPARIAENRARAMTQLGLSDADLCTAYQCHGTRCVTVTGLWKRDDRPRVDAMVTDRPGVALGVLTADCAPVLFADSRARVIGVAHAGWRGVLAGVLESAVEAMAGLGAGPGDTIAAVGPCIAQASYEVGPELVAAFTEADAANAGFFAPSAREGHAMFDLAGYIVRRLSALGLAEVSLIAHDTCADEDRFFSYRRARKRGDKDYGRLLSAIALAGRGAARPARRR